MSSMKKNRPAYSSEFKEQAVAKCMEIGALQASRELGVAESTLRKWQKASVVKLGDNRNKPSYEQLESEVRKLKKELSYVEEINRILKKSTAIFSANLMGDSK